VDWSLSKPCKLRNQLTSSIRRQSKKGQHYDEQTHDEGRIQRYFLISTSDAVSGEHQAPNTIRRGEIPLCPFYSSAGTQNHLKTSLILELREKKGGVLSHCITKGRVTSWSSRQHPGRKDTFGWGTRFILAILQILKHPPLQSSFTLEVYPSCTHARTHTLEQ
jgi:hypothetical protein